MVCVLVIRSCTGPDPTDLQRQLDASNNALTQARQQSADLQRQLEESQQRYDQIQKQRDGLQNLLGEKEREVASERDKGQKLAEQVASLENTNKQQQEERKTPEASLANLVQENAALKVPRPDQNLQIASLESQIQRLEEQLNRKDEQIRALERHNREDASSQREESPPRPQLLAQRWYRTKHRIQTSYWAHRYEPKDEVQAGQCIWVADVNVENNKLMVEDRSSGRFLGYISSDDARPDSTCP